MKNTITSAFTNSQPILQRMLDIVSVILVVICAYTLAEITWSFAPQIKEPAPIQSTSENVITNKQKHSQQSFRQLSNAHLFGIANNKIVKTTTKMPETKSNLVLKGVLAATPMSLASAIIARNKNSKEEIYGIGDLLPGKIKIEAIHPNYVILNRSGRIETLRLPKESNLNSSSGLPTNGKSRTLSSGQSLKNVRNHLLKNPTSFGDYALPIVIKENGKQIGYRLSFQKKGDVLKNAGLMSTDIITKINGIKLDKPHQAMKALQKLGTAKQLDILVKRNGAEVPISIQIP